MMLFCIALDLSLSPLHLRMSSCMACVVDPSQPLKGRKGPIDGWKGYWEGAFRTTLTNI